MKFILLALIMSSFCRADAIVLNSGEAPRNKILGGLSILLPTVHSMQKELLEHTRDSIAEKMQIFWEKMRGIYKNNGPVEEAGRGTPPHRDTPPRSASVQPVSRSENIQTINNEDGSVYVGHVRNQQPWGFGSMTYSNGSRYEGFWRDGLRDGPGTFFFEPNRLVIWESGLWRDNEKIGPSTKELKPGVIDYGCHLYLGPVGTDRLPDTLVSGEFGILESAATGFQYIGEFAQGVRSGRGTQYYADGNSHFGWWENDEKAGVGISITPDVCTIIGHWAGSRLTENSDANVLYPNGTRYQGSLDGDFYRHGLGTMHYWDGSFVTSTWERGQEGFGRGYIRFEDGTAYRGETFDGEADGLGYLEANDGIHRVTAFQGSLEYDHVNDGGSSDGWWDEANAESNSDTGNVRAQALLDGSFDSCFSDF